MNNYQKYKERHKLREKKRYRSLHDKAVSNYGRWCLCCRVEAKEFLVVCDKFGHTRQDVLKMKEYPDGLITLCRNCAFCMISYDECIHQTPVGF